MAYEKVYKYRVRCVTEGKNILTWSEDEPTVCPNNDGHTIDASKTTIIGAVTRDFPVSTIDGSKVAVHPSYKPREELETYVVWAGCGDNISDPDDIGGGELLDFHLSPGTSTQTVDVKFNPLHGRVWIHEGYLKFTGGGVGDYMEAVVVTDATPLQQSVNLDLVVDGDGWISYSPGGPGTGTDGFADATKIQLIPRSFMGDGDWDYDGADLTPNMSGTGGYKISNAERSVHKFFSKIPCYGECTTYFSMSSDETTELPANFFMRVTAHNVSDTTWHANIVMEIYRERTFIP